MPARILRMTGTSSAAGTPVAHGSGGCAVVPAASAAARVRIAAGTAALGTARTGSAVRQASGRYLRGRPYRDAQHGETGSHTDAAHRHAPAECPPRLAAGVRAPGGPLNESRPVEASHHEPDRRLVQRLSERLARPARYLGQPAPAVPLAPHGSGRRSEAVSAVRPEVVDDRLNPNVPNDQAVSSRTHRWQDGITGPRPQAASRKAPTGRLVAGSTPGASENGRRPPPLCP